jgi:hypothetical protein
LEIPEGEKGEKGELFKNIDEGFSKPFHFMGAPIGL